MKANTNYLRLTLLKVKMCQYTQISKYKLKFDFQKQSQESELLPGKEVELGKVYF
jgi:hypothetical protein